MSRVIHILWAGRPERGAWEELCRQYRQRIGHYRPIRDRSIRTQQIKDVKARRRAEEKALLAALPDPAWVVALDRRGKSINSGDFASWLGNLSRDWPHPLVFVVGSDLGLGKGLLTTAQESFSLGRMTLPHQLARLVVYEQLYRALSIAAGMKYHREPL